MKAIEIRDKQEQKALEILANTCLNPKNDRARHMQGLQYIYHDALSHKLIATNTRVMAVYECTTHLEEQLIDIKYLSYSKGVLIEVDCNMEYPDWNRIVPKEGYINFPPVRGEGNSDKLLGLRNMAIMCASTGVVFDLAFSKSFEFEITEWHPSQAKDKDCEYFSSTAVKNNSLTVVIMPMAGEYYQTLQNKLNKS